MNNNETSISEESQQVEKNLLSDGVRIFGLVCMSITICTACYLGAWVLWNRKSRVVLQMQPVFLMMLIVGVVIQTFSILPSGANDENTEHIDAACLSYFWLISMGSTLTLSALFSKLWRVNRLFHAQGFQRKVVAVKDVLTPFLVLLGVNLALLIVLTVVDPPVWIRQPIDEMKPYDTYGRCQPQGWIGILAIFFIVLTDFSALIFLCVQAYKARDISSDFSEARGVALALFSNLQGVIIAAPTTTMLNVSDVNAHYMIQTMQEFVTGMAMLLFIFGPLVAQQRAQEASGRKSSGRTRISGLDGNTTTTVQGGSHSLGGRHSQWRDEEEAAPSSLELEIERLRSRIAELEGMEEISLKPDETETTSPS